MKKGTVKFFNGSKGFGFIIDNETKKNTLYTIQDLKILLRRPRSII